jgi:hypothetical protein
MIRVEPAGRPASRSPARTEAIDAASSPGLPLISAPSATRPVS